jgi:hypothetical protein
VLADAGYWHRVQMETIVSEVTADSPDFGHLGGEDDLLLLGNGLCVVALLPTMLRLLQPAIRIGQSDLSLGSSGSVNHF